MDYVTLLGLIAAFCTTIAFLPQVWKIWKSRCAEDISLTTFLIFTAGVFFWLIYGFLVKDFPIMAANSITLILGITILIFKIKYG